MRSFESLAAVLRTVVRGVRYAGFVFVAFAAWLIGREVYVMFRACADVHVVLGIGFLLGFGAVFYYFIVRPALRYLRLPKAVRPPDLPALRSDEQLQPAHLAARANGIASYLENMARNPNLDSRQEIAAARQDLEAELSTYASLDAGTVKEARTRLIRFEHERVEPLLAPLDDKARSIIRAESMAVAVATAVSPSGAFDSFFVLWRNANLVSRLAQLYYGRPGVRGTFLVLRDVSFAMFLASQMEGLTEKTVQATSGFLGKAASPVAGPLADGVVNGLVTMRVGYVAMKRCRAFRAFTERSVASFLSAAFREAAKQSAGFATDLVTKVGRPILQLPVEAGKKLVDWVTDSVRSWFGNPEPSPDRAGG